MTAPVWQRSSFCADGSCVEVRRNGDRVEVRDSKLGEESSIANFTPGQWSTVLRMTKRFELETWDAFAAFAVFGEPDELVFNDAEKAAFVAGVRAGQFDVERLTAEWQAAERDPAALVDVDPEPWTQEGINPASVALGPESGPVASDDHPAVTLPDSILSKVQKVERLDVQPGDVLAVHVDTELITHQEADNIRRYMQRAVPGVRVLVLAGAQLKLISSTQADEIEASHG